MISTKYILVFISEECFITKGQKYNFSPQIISFIFNTTLYSIHSLMDLSPSWEAANCAATQELPSVLWNPKVHYRVNKSPPLVPIPSLIHPIHTIPFYFSEIHSNIVHPPTSWSFPWSLSFWILHQYAICMPLLPQFVLHTLHISHYTASKTLKNEYNSHYKVEVHLCTCKKHTWFGNENSNYMQRTL
jgi:hypothetical protein